jgi:hypothetical protein
MLEQTIAQAKHEEATAEAEREIAEVQEPEAKNNELSQEIVTLNKKQLKWIPKRALDSEARTVHYHFPLLAAL